MCVQCGLNDIFSDIGQKLGITGAVEQVDATTKTLDKTSTSIDKVVETVDDLKKDYDAVKPVLYVVGGILITKWLTEIYYNYYQGRK